MINLIVTNLRGDLKVLSQGWVHDIITYRFDREKD